MHEDGAVFFVGRGYAGPAEVESGSITSAQGRDLFRAATLEPVEALGRDDLGRLAPGAQADYFVLDLNGTHIGPYADPIRTLVMNCDGRDISRVVVAGRTIVVDKQIVTVDTSDYRQRAVPAELPGVLSLRLVLRP